ncbi:MAG: imidazoleglycerol-phosphate dehydratase HisB [Anaerolineae bacterium]|jgi:imidazoleglycerol-phosphate dehydratase|nr:imidazoleglycerol-phosphate dehydratase HisB [Anaerolineae bacterium]MBT7071034.1 imidazoleglycerol-phosphate dehydratase HisB [Anaerolineae bacterium]MBT7323740.1 imidazoleglycerol-phosphate dehydratase HisB [Anaerolineae bacterium]
MRTASIQRKTKETNISLSVNLDGTGEHNISTGIGFFDHMLTQIAVHGLIDIDLQAEGDLHIDAHHTIEDCGIVLGEGIGQALGSKLGIRRMAEASVPMDDALANVILDLSGRPYSVIQIPWVSPSVGNIPTSLIEHFFETVAVSAKMNLHIRVFYGKDNHHIAEATFKAFARALDAAVQVDERRAGIVPSSKGKL